MTTNWGIIAPGGIAKKFAQAINAIDEATLFGVAGRSHARATRFAEEMGVQRAYENYSAMLADPAIQVVYIASPHQAHLEHAQACLHAGKAVLCEKPITVNKQQSQALFDLAKQNDLFCMEALWSRFLPIFDVVNTWLDEAAIGNIQRVQFDFGINVPFDPEHRLYNPELAGGAILDLGVYAVTIADWLFKEAPHSVQAIGSMSKSGVDDSVAFQLGYSNGRIAQLGCASNHLTSHEVRIYGSEGNIVVHSYPNAERASLMLNQANQPPITIEKPHQINGFEYQIYEVHRCLAAGEIQSDTLPWNTSLRVMAILDELRTQVGMRYAFE